MTASTRQVGCRGAGEDSPHPPSRQGELYGIQMVLCMQSTTTPWGRGLSATRSDSVSPREPLQREGGTHISRLQGKDYSREDIWQSTSVLLSSQAKNSLLAHVENNLQAAETPRVPRLLSITQFSSVFTETLLCARYCAKFRMRTLPFMESQNLKRKKINQAKCQT